MGPVLLTNRPFRLAAATAWLALAALGLTGLYDVKSQGVTDRSPGWLYTAAGLILGLRALRLGVRLQDQRVVVRSWLRTRVLPAPLVAGAQVVPYSGALAPKLVSPLVMPRLLLHTGDYLDVPAVPGLARTGRMADLAARLTLALRSSTEPPDG
jgi:hypothetical protein